MEFWPYKDENFESLGEVSLAILSSTVNRHELTLSYWIALVDYYERISHHDDDDDDDDEDGGGGGGGGYSQLAIVNTYNRFLATGNLDNEEKFQVEHENKNFSRNVQSLSDETSTQIISLSIDGKFYMILITLQPSPSVVIFDDYQMKTMHGILCTSDEEYIFMIPNVNHLMEKCTPPVQQLMDIVFGFNIGETLYLISMFEQYVLRVQKRLVISFQRKFRLHKPRLLDDFIVCMKPTIWPPLSDIDLYGQVQTVTPAKITITDVNFTEQKQSLHYGDNYQLHSDRHRSKHSMWLANFKISIIIVIMFIKYLITITIYFNVGHYCRNICFHL
ncbi:hypothetical protein BLA29_004046 [Euroglyphus maynei]|uniref:Uncharacterized protein n=1 Tax=Euroglyphus maynei TaxID=6958 RepID=A0A1Y3BJR6_EURMA|nr:hypothetical protein BLA29_004046 [Euroglyphus maynei]